MLYGKEEHISKVVSANQGIYVPEQALKFKREMIGNFYRPKRAKTSAKPRLLDTVATHDS